jgi:hypothetical protein
MLLNHLKGKRQFILKTCLISSVCIFFIVSSSLEARDRHPQPIKPAKPKPLIIELHDASEIIQKSEYCIETLEILLESAYQIAEQTNSGSYSQMQREALDASFQRILNLIDPIGELSVWNGQSMLASENSVLRIRVGRNLLQFHSLDLSRNGLNLEDCILFMDFSGNITFPNPFETFDRVESAVQKVKNAKLVFAGYHNILSRYLPLLQPDCSTATELGLEILEASKEKAQLIQSDLTWTIALTDQSANGPYSEQQRTIMNNEFEQQLDAYTRNANHAYYGMGIIDGQNTLTVNTCTKTLQFDGFDLTREGLGLIETLNIQTPESAQLAMPYLEAALTIVEETIASLEQDIDLLSDYLQ